MNNVQRFQAMVGTTLRSQGYAMFLDHVSDENGNPVVELWRFCSEDDFAEGNGFLEIEIHEIVETQRSGVLAVYYRQWIAPDERPAWGNRRKRTIGSVASLSALISRRKMTPFLSNAIGGQS